MPDTQSQVQQAVEVPRNRQERRERPRITAEEVCRNQPTGHRAEVVALNQETVRRHLKLLVFEGPQGFKVFPYRARQVQKDGVPVSEDYLPHDPAHLAFDVSMFSGDTLERLTEVVGDLARQQADRGKEYKQPLTHKLEGLKGIQLPSVIRADSSPEAVEKLLKEADEVTGLYNEAMGATPEIRNTLEQLQLRLKAVRRQEETIKAKEADIERRKKYLEGLENFNNSWEARLQRWEDRLKLRESLYEKGAEDELTFIFTHLG